MSHAKMLFRSPRQFLHFLRCCLTLMVCFNPSIPISAQSLAGDRVTFEDAWLQVEMLNDGIAAGEANVERAALTKEAAQSLSYPRVDLISTYTRLDDAIELNALEFNPLNTIRSSQPGSGIIELLGGDEAFTTELSDETFARSAITALWPIYTGGKISAAQEASKAQQNIAAHLLDAKRRTVFEEFVQIYFGLILARQNHATRAAAQNGLFEHLNNARKLEREGLIARVERLVVEAAHDRAVVAEKRSDQEREIAEISLQQLMHRDSRVIPADELFINAELPVLDIWLSEAILNSPAIKMLESQDREAEAILKAERGRFHPEVFLYADYALYQDDAIAFELLPDWQVGIGMNITLLDQINRSKSVGAAERARVSLQDLQNEARRKLVVATEVLYREADIALNEFHGLGTTLDLANENLRLRRIAFSQGLSTSVELVDAQLFVASVRTAMSAAAFSYIDRLAKILALTGNTQQFGQFQQRGQPVTLSHHSVAPARLQNKDQKDTPQ